MNTCKFKKEISLQFSEQLKICYLPSKNSQKKERMQTNLVLLFCFEDVTFQCFFSKAKFSFIIVSSSYMTKLHIPIAPPSAV